MTKLLELAVETAKALPNDAQDEIARVMLQLANDHNEGVVNLSPDERAAIAVSKAAARRQEFASDAEVRSVWAKHGL